MMVQVGYYYTIHLPLYNQQIRPEPDFVDTAYRTVDMLAGTQAYLLTGRTIILSQLDAVLAMYQADSNLQWVHPFEFPYQQLHRLPTNQPYAFFIAPDDHATRQNLQRVFGDRLLRAAPSPYNIPIDKQYELYLVGIGSS